MTERLRLVPDDATQTEGDEEEASPVHFYESTVTHAVTGERLVTLITIAPFAGMRLTKAQVVELRDWLNDWLPEAVS